MKTSSRFFSPLSFAAFVFVTAAVARADGPYRFVKDIAVPGEGSWDYLVTDSAAHRLYVSHGNVVAVIDTQKDEVVGQIEDTAGVHGIAIAPKLARGFTSNGRENKVSVFDPATLKTLSKIDVGQNPDWIMFEPNQGEVYTFNGRSKDSTVIDAASGKVVATIPLGGKPETAMVDPSLGRIYDNIEDTNEIVAIDTKTHTVAARWSIAPNKAASGMAIDLAHKRLFVGCGDSNTMAMVDYTNGKVLAAVPIDPGVDACAFDPATQLAFASSGSGTVTIAHEDAPDKLTVVQTLATDQRARTMALDPVTHRIYLSTAKFVAPAGGARGRGAMVPGTFRVRVYELAK